MNLPEGVLRERLRLAFAKTMDNFDDLALLELVGSSQMGRIRYTGQDQGLDELVPFESVGEILANRRGAGDLYRYLIEKFAQYSGVSGVQPKVMVRDEESFLAGRSRDGFDAANAAFREGKTGIRGATHVIKFWDATEYPELAANEFFCLKVAQAAGLRLPKFDLAEDGSALVVERFDLRPDGIYRGMEDFCVLNARGTADKYRGSYESAILRRFESFAAPARMYAQRLELYTLIVLNCALRNGDAHLKNFAVLYDDVLGECELSPVYDIVTTSAYIPQDRMALTLNGTKEWPTGKVLQKFGEQRGVASPQVLRHVFERVCDAIAQVTPKVEQYRRQHPEFAEIGGRMLECWAQGIASLRQ
jgi:serine/threonine-protein kinase HipA